ncbi:hypothetical protein L218DRAFT_1009462 [Marasmius fiardii PR-910]|nr:hypothetical protein L218DRAFT_1009462 [Marasmius fiardii PR-910]
MRVLYRSAPLPGVNDFSTTDGSPVPNEVLSKLGIKVEELGTGPEAQARAQSIAQSAGYPNPKGFKFAYSEMDESRYQYGYARVKFIFQHFAPDLCLTRAALSVLFKLRSQALVLSGKPYVDMEDLTSNQWIRISLTAGDFISFPENCLLRIGMDLETLRDLSGIVSMNIENADLDTLFSSTHMAFGEDIKKHQMSLGVGL